jgi:PAS domain S-box-containing protein
MPEDKNWCILLVDDDEDDYLLVKHMLSKTQSRKCELDWASSFDSGLQLIQNKDYDAVLIDYDLGFQNGLDLIRLANQQDYPFPFILFTGRGTYEIDLEAMRAGATIYLTKSEVTTLLLERAIRYAIELKQNARNLSIQNQQLQNEIEERKRVEATLLGILNATKESIWLFAVDGTVLLANDTAIERIKTPREEVIGTNFRVLMSAELAASRAMRLDEVIKSGKPLEFEDVRAGITFNHSFYPVLDSSGKITSVVSFSRDITRQKQGEIELQTAHRKIHDILESIGDAFYSLDENLRFIYVNRKAGEIWHKEPDELIGKSIMDVFPQFEGTESYIRITAAIREGKSDQYETYSAFLDQWVEVHLYPAERGLSVYFQDITQRKKMEQALKDLRERNQ